jgi:cellobiose phosphorylase
MGPSRAQNAPYIVTELDAQTGALFAQNPWNAEFAQRVAFIDMAGAQDDWTGDRTQFLGRNGGLQRPAVLALGAPLGKQVGRASIRAARCARSCGCHQANASSSPCCWARERTMPKRGL